MKTILLLIHHATAFSRAEVRKKLTLSANSLWWWIILLPSSSLLVMKYCLIYKPYQGFYDSYTYFYVSVELVLTSFFFTDALSLFWSPANASNIISPLFPIFSVFFPGVLKRLLECSEILADCFPNMVSQ